MPAPPTITDVMLASAAAVLKGKDYGLRGLLDAVQTATYVTDSDGLVIYANEACATFAGRQPEPGVDRWCVTWKLFSEAGEVLPHDECPMAMAIRLKRPVRGIAAVAERPDGTRVGFMPLPTPIFGRERELVGAVNMLVPREAD